MHHTSWGTSVNLALKFLPPIKALFDIKLHITLQCDRPIIVAAFIVTTTRTISNVSSVHHRARFVNTVAEAVFS